MKRMQDSGGWLDRTTVEDMDIAVRVHLNGWTFIFLNDVRALCEQPESYEAYKKQQHRWHSGPMQLFGDCFNPVALMNGFSQKKTGRASESDLLALTERESLKSGSDEKISRRHSESGLELLSKLKEQDTPLLSAKKKNKNRIYRNELALAFLLLTAAARSLLSAHGVHFYFLLFQGLSFLVVGLDLIGEQIS
ncbi:hypothetical protein ACFE04_011268 [Oxalis oulophora]